MPISLFVHVIQNAGNGHSVTHFRNRIVISGVDVLHVQSERIWYLRDICILPPRRAASAGGGAHEGRRCDTGVGRLRVERG